MVLSPANSELPGVDLISARKAIARSAGTSVLAVVAAVAPAGFGRRGSSARCRAQAAMASASATIRNLTSNRGPKHVIGDLLPFGNGGNKITRNPAHHERHAPPVGEVGVQPVADLQPRFRRFHHQETPIAIKRYNLAGALGSRGRRL